MNGQYDIDIIRSNSNINREIDYMSIAKKLFKRQNISMFKKTNLAKSKKSDLINIKFFAMGNSFKIDFLTLETKKYFIYLQKNFIQAIIFGFFDTKRYIYIKTDILGYIINRVLTQISLNY